MAATVGHYRLDDLAARIVGCFPQLDSVEQALSLELYRLLAKGQPVPPEALTERLGISSDVVKRTLDGWPGLFSDAQRRIVGYRGLSIPSAYTGPHRFMVDSRVLAAWCAWDTLFLPQLLDQTADIESTSPVGGEVVRLRVTPERVERVEPAGATMSILLPDAKEVKKDVVSSFCHFIYFFPSRQVGEKWAVQHPRTFLLSVHEAHVLARLKNAGQYPDFLR